MDFSSLKRLTIPEGEVSKITVGGVVIWKKPSNFLPHTNLVPNAKNTDGTILDGVGYREGYHWLNGSLSAKNTAFTAIGLIPFGDGTVAHSVYVYGLNFSGSAYNTFGLFDSSFASIAEIASVKDGFSNAQVIVKKLSDNYFQFTTAAYSARVEYFAISGVTVSGLTPIVTLDEPIF